MHQSKYAVGDSYDENGIEGTVGYIGDDVRYIYKDIGMAAWSTENVKTGANSEDDGEYNMNIIKNIPNWENIYPAFLICEQLNTKGKTGWYIPSRNELILVKHDYMIWSSTEYDSHNACINYMVPNYKLKAKNLPVYAVHKF